jgi:hypothetical protein
MGKSGYSKLHSIRGSQEGRGRRLLRLDDPVRAALSRHVGKVGGLAGVSEVRITFIGGGQRLDPPIEKDGCWMFPRICSRFRIF